MQNLIDLNLVSYFKFLRFFENKEVINEKLKDREGAPKMDKKDKITSKPFVGFVNN